MRIVAVSAVPFVWGPAVKNSEGKNVGAGVGGFVTKTCTTITLKE